MEFMRLSRTLILGAVTLCLLPSSLHATDHFVSPTGANISPFLTWSDAAPNIQETIDSSAVGDNVWVTNGLYATGTKVLGSGNTNRIALNKALTVQSINGPFQTVIQGNNTSSVRCAWLTN